MLQVNMLEAKTNLSRLVAGLENHTNDEVILARDGKPVAKIIPILSKRKCFIGAGAGRFVLPSVEETEKFDEEFLEEFEDELL